MACFFVVTKLLMLKILLASISGLHGYDFGYHPSAEEFDNFMRETARTWTRDLLASERRRAWTVPETRNDAGFFVPKYRYKTEHTRFAATTASVPHSWPGYVQKVQRPQQHRNDQQSAAAANQLLIDSSNIGSSLDFTLFSDEQQEVAEQHVIPQSPVKNDVQPFQGAEILKPLIPVPGVTNAPPLKQTLNAVIEIAPSSNDEAIEENNVPVLQQQSPMGQLHKNSTAAHFPIFFTNPATGIVYAISEVGKMQNDSIHADDRIPIYITKEQYDRDLYLLRKYYEKRCRPANSTPSVISMPANTTVRPQIIRLQKPQNSISKLPITKLPTALHKPPPVMVQTEVTVSDQVHMPVRRKKKTKAKRKKKKTKRPGHKPGAPIAHSPAVLSTTKTFIPQIVLGTSSPTNTEKQMSTQLEKPSLTTTIFSKQPFKKTGGVMTPTFANHRMRRSVTQIREEMQQAQNEKNSTNTGSTWVPNLSPLQRSLGQEKGKATDTRSIHKLRTRKRGLPRLGNRTIAHKLSVRTQNGTENLLFPNGYEMRERNKRKKVSTTEATNVEAHSKPHSNSTSKAPNVKQNTYRNSVRSVMAKNVTSTKEHKATRKKSKHKRRKKHEKRNKDNNSFDIFDLMDDDEDDEDDYGSDENDDSYSADNDIYYEYDEAIKPPTKNKHTTFSTESSATEEDYTEENIDDLREPLPTDNSSSAEENADFGAMDETPEWQMVQQQAQLALPTANTKNTGNKKRIRRRPPTAAHSSDEDYEDDDDGGGGVGDFFRMIFYPVQVFMNRVFDGFSNKDDESEHPTYPTYTVYNSAVASVDSEEEEEQGNALSSWFSSWFGFNRRTKKIGSTTPSPQPPPPTEPSGWFESWFGNQDTSYEDEENGKWFFGWFDSKPKRRRKATTTTTTVHTPLAQVPILTIVDPLKNPQNWIGILAHHIINSTSTTTQNPIINAIKRGTSTALQNPDIPRRVTYDKYQIWRLKPLDDGQVQSLEEYKRSEEGAKLQWLKGPSLRGLTDVLVPPRMLLDFEATLSFESIAHEVLIYDVGKAIAYEKAQERYYFSTTPRPQRQNQNNNKPQKHSPPPNMSWHKYYEYDDIISHLEQLRMRYPQLIELIHIGRSYEGRPLVIVKVESRELSTSLSEAEYTKHKKLKHKKKPNEANAVFIEAGTHGLEWIGPATTLWMISELLRLMKSNKTSSEHEYIRNTTWYLMPILNPDGYVYSHKYDRFWKKSRSRHISKPNGIINSAMTWLQQKKIPERVCFGVDLDRNWQYQWGKRGSSNSPCNELYAGPAAFSEPETKALAEFLMDYRKQLKLYLSLQAYGQIISYPIKDNASYNAERIDDFLDVAMVGTDGLRKKGSKSRYKIDTSSDLVEHRSGCSDAFAAYEVGIPFSYTIQLADNGVHGYLLPSASIEQTARDAFEVITAMIDYI